MILCLWFLYYQDSQMGKPLSKLMKLGRITELSQGAKNSKCCLACGALPTLQWVLAILFLLSSSSIASTDLPVVGL